MARHVVHDEYVVEGLTAPDALRILRGPRQRLSPRRVSLLMPADQHAALVRWGRDRGLTLSAAVRRLLGQCFQQQQPGQGQGGTPLPHPAA